MAEAIDLAKVPGLIQAVAAPARLQPKPITPDYLQFQDPPLVIDGAVVDAAETDDGFRVRFKLYEYGIVSVALSRPFAGSWIDLVSLGHRLIENEEIQRRADRLCDALVDRLASGLDGRRSTFLAEDYLVFSVTKLAEPLLAEDLIEAHGDEIALLLRGEKQALSRQEQDEVLRHQLSYLADDLVVPTWNAAFVYDTDAGVRAALELLEFANSQLLEFRYYDERLDNELERIYGELQRSRGHVPILGGTPARAARQLHALFIEVNELTDKAENALKLVGDVYAARLFSLVAARLGLNGWKASVKDKLDTLDDIYRFTVEQSGISRGNALELVIVLILVLELILFFAGIMK